MAKKISSKVGQIIGLATQITRVPRCYTTTTLKATSPIRPLLMVQTLLSPYSYVPSIPQKRAEISLLGATTNFTYTIL